MIFLLKPFSLYVFKMLYSYKVSSSDRIVDESLIAFPSTPSVLLEEKNTECLEYSKLFLSNSSYYVVDQSLVEFPSPPRALLAKNDGRSCG